MVAWRPRERSVRRDRKDVGENASITANVDIGKVSEGGFVLAVELVGRMPGVLREEAEDSMHEAHQVCPYSRATRGNMDVKPSVAE